jgi:hypothetical protein
MVRATIDAVLPRRPAATEPHEDSDGDQARDAAQHRVGRDDRSGMQMSAHPPRDVNGDALTQRREEEDPADEQGPRFEGMFTGPGPPVEPPGQHRHAQRPAPEEPHERQHRHDESLTEAGHGIRPEQDDQHDVEERPAGHEDLRMKRSGNGTR